MIENVWYVNVYVSDFDRAVKFYRDTVGLALGFRDDEFGYASFDTGGAMLAVARVDSADAALRSLVGRHTGVALGVRDLDAEYETLKARGVVFTQTPQKMPWGGTMAMFKDPDGNVFYLDQLRGNRQPPAR